MPTAKIKIFPVNGDPRRPHTAELSDWSGEPVAGPRSEFESVVAREGAQEAGTYFVTKTDPESGKPSIRIGEAQHIKDRLRNHLKRDYWNQIAFFVSEDESLTNSYIRYLEGSLILTGCEANVSAGRSADSRICSVCVADMPGISSADSGLV